MFRSSKGTKTNTKPSPFIATFSSRSFTVMLGLGIVVFGVGLTKELVRKIQIRQQIQALEAEIADLEQHNGELDEMVQYFNSSAFNDKEARTKLGLAAPGETMVVLPGSTTTPSSSSAETQQQLSASDTRSNLQKWQDYFFKQ